MTCLALKPYTQVFDYLLISIRLWVLGSAHSRLVQYSGAARLIQMTATTGSSSYVRARSAYFLAVEGSLVTSPGVRL